MDNDAAQKLILKYVDNAKKNRVPIQATFEIIAGCNFNCVHCYIPNRSKMIKVDDFKRIVEECYDMGCRFITITGGEPLLHPNFFEMYEYAWKKGMSVTVFSNGSLIDEKAILFFKNYPPKHIEITVYGASNEAYKKVTSKNNGLDMVEASLRRIKQSGIKLRLKTFVLNENVEEFEKIKLLCQKYSDDFRYDYDVMPKTNKDQSPVNFGVPKEREQELSSKEREEKEHQEIIDDIYLCSAGRSSFYVGSDLTVRICNFATFTNFSLLESSFKDIWNEIGKLLETKIDRNSKCCNCLYRSFCEICPVKSYLFGNKGDSEINLSPVPRYCERAEKSYNLYWEKKKRETKKALAKIIKDNLEKGKTVKGKLFGTSMMPTIMPETVIFIKKFEQYKKDDIVVFDTAKQGYFVVHRIVAVNDSKAFIKGDNRDKIDEVDLSLIYGKVIENGE